MRVTVAVMPSLLVTVLSARRNQAIQHLGKILLQARLEFNRANRAGAAHDEELGHAGLDAGLADDAADGIAEVLHVTVAARVDGKRFLKDHEYLLRARTSMILCVSLLIHPLRACKDWPSLR